MQLWQADLELGRQIRNEMSNAKLNATRSALFATEAKSIMIARGSVTVLFV
jgi:hypothetical protein